MRWFVLFAVLGGIFWTANWSYHLLDNAVLITNYFKATTVPETWGLVDFRPEKPVAYDYIATSGYWEIFKGLWPVWSLFILSFVVLVPLSIYLYNSLNNAQITAAKEAQFDAEERARKAESNAKIFEQKAKSWAEERVDSAYQEQLSRVKKELEAEWANYHKQKNQIIERESTIQNRERAAQQMEDLAKERVDNIIGQYNQEKARFQAQMLDMARTRDNAQAGYKRIKMKWEKQNSNQ